MLNELLEREFEKLHGIKWTDAAFSVRACWTDAWLTATKAEREKAMAAILDGCPSDGSDVEIALRRAWERVLRSNTQVNPAGAASPVSEANEG